MVYSGIIATVADLTNMAGENVDATGWTEANQNLWIAQAEGYLCTLFRYDIITNWATLNAKGKLILTEYGARYCAVCGIAYNMEGFTTRIEAEDMINIHVYRMRAIEKILENENFIKFIKTA